MYYFFHFQITQTVVSIFVKYYDSKIQELYIWISGVLWFFVIIGLGLMKLTYAIKYEVKGVQSEHITKKIKNAEELWDNKRSFDSVLAHE